MQYARLHFPIITVRKKNKKRKKREEMIVNIENNEYFKAT